MPQPAPRPDKEPIEKLKDLIGFKWSTIIVWLLALIPAAFGIGIKVGLYMSESGKNYEMTKMSLDHQKEVYQAKEEGRQQAQEEQKKITENAEYILTIIEKARKNEK